MKRIYKYELLGFTSELSLPVGAKILTAAAQAGTLCVWAEVAFEGETYKHRFAVVPTGSTPPDDKQYLSTVFFQDGALVYHVYC